METALAEPEIEEVETEGLSFRDTFYKIATIIEQDFPDKPFRPQNIGKKLLENEFVVHLRIINRFLYTRVKNGALEKIGRGLYKIKSVTLLSNKQRFPKSFFSENVWQILCQATEPMCLKDVVIEIEERWNLTESLSSKDISRPVATVLWSLYKSGAINRFGGKGNYTYQKNPLVTERPSLTK